MTRACGWEATYETEKRLSLGGRHPGGSYGAGDSGGFFWTPYDPTAISVGPKFAPPSLQHLLGTDNFGRDILSRVMKGAGTTFAIGAATVAIGAVCGTAVGALTGYFGGVADEILMRLNDALTAFPSILLALVVISLLGPGSKYNVIIALGLVFIPSFARVTRTAFAGLRDVNYVKSARLMGASPGRILVVHILPNTLSVLLPAVTIGFNNAVLAEASMSFLASVSPAGRVSWLHALRGPEHDRRGPLVRHRHRPCHRGDGVQRGSDR